MPDPWSRPDVDRRGVPRRALPALAVLAVAVIVMSVDVIALGDDTVLSYFIRHRTTRWIDAAKIVTTAGDVAVLIPLSLLVAIVLWWRAVPRLLACAPAATLAVAGVITAAGKAVLGRVRPPVALHLVTETEASMPSGHTADGTALYLSIAIVLGIVAWRSPARQRILAVAAAVLSVAVGLSRLELGVHWPTDVIVGWLLGATVAVAVVSAAVALERRRGARRGHVAASMDRRVTGSSEAEVRVPMRSIRTGCPRSRPGLSIAHQHLGNR